ncbi:MAG: glycosyltransferase [Bacteroidia bacterium]|nr:glycosyltransferase [Bacteroidia bacterium]NNF32278.1 glycosyltransferase [Flavobacteriaceae bacterium]MBT8276920.1 glycosyltransferase [Bacteroidia bacterium]NNJ83299.1 glycosyltransferase [Flavobacteriaceae bacterium]NNK53763.1 glycosyltransferase [Flavobacteriaceae bacterium]
MSKSLSILIPTYEYDVYTLVERLHAQAMKAAFTFEISVLDDCSPNPPPANEKINSLAHCNYSQLPQNIGRSAIRNLLAEKATFDTLLFLDADTMIFRKDFIETYLDAIDADTQIIYGGIVYQKEVPPADEKLRWVYGNKREALPVSERIKQPHLRFLTLNFLIKKSVFSTLKFNEKIPNLRHEDTLFALDSKKKNIRVRHIDNPVVHLGLESSEVFLRKSNEAVDALKLFVQEGLINAEETSLSKKGEQIKGGIMGALVKLVYALFKKPMEKNLLSASPSLKIFDLYRLGYYLQKSEN